MRSPCTLLITMALAAGSAIGVDAEDAPPPSTTEHMLAGMVTEAVEPGVLRVVNDGVRDLGWGKTEDGPSDIVAGRDGGVWLFDPPDSSVRLGDETEYEWGAASPDHAVDVTPDGTVWRVDTTGSVSSFDGRTWTEHTPAMNSDEGWNQATLKVGPDSAVWALSRDDDSVCAGPSRARCRHTVLTSLDRDGEAVTARDWSDLYDGPVAADALAVSPHGEVWLMGVRGTETSGEVEVLLRYDGRTWHLEEVPEGLRNVWAGQSFDIGADGSLWAGSGFGDTDGLARLDDTGWTVFTEADGVQRWGTEGFIPTDHLHVAADGSVWVNAEGAGVGCGGVANFDGTTWTSYLEDLCVHDMDIAPDGAVWIRAGGFRLSGGFEYWDSPGLYVITPEAAAAAEAEVTEPPSVEEASTTAVDLPATIVTEEVEPGVLRLVSDGRFDLTQAGWEIARTAIAPDGSAWMFGPESFFRLGSEGDLRDWPVGWPNDTGFAANGDIWATYPGTIRVFDGRDWTTHSVDVTAYILKAAPDGKVWVHGDVDDTEVIGWFEPDSAEFNPVREGDVLTQIGLASGGAWSMRRAGTLALYRWTTGEWEELPDWPDPRHGVLGIGPDGTVWTARCPGMGCGGPWASNEDATLARQVGDEWQESAPAAHGLTIWGIERVAPDGSIWGHASPRRPDVCRGIVRFDGAHSERWLDGHCIEAIELDRDGNAWVQAFQRSTLEGSDRTDDGPVETYVISPEATEGGQ